MTLTLSGIEFDQHEYDEVGDVLYLSVGEPQVAAVTLPTPEGHAVDYDASGAVVGMVLASVKALIERDGELRITWPEVVGHVPSEWVAVALAAVA